MIDVAGTEYALDLTNGLMIPSDPSLEIILLGELDVAIDHEWEYTGFYDTHNQRLFKVTEDLVEMPPDHIVAFVLPTHRDLEEMMERQQPIVAKIWPIETSEMPHIIEENRLQKETGVIDTETEDRPERSIRRRKGI